MLNELFGNIIDHCILFDKTKRFNKKVTKSEAPDYLDRITKPIGIIEHVN